MDHTSMHDLMLGMFWGGMLLAAPPVLIGVAVAAFMLHQQKRDKEQGAGETTGE